MSNMNIKEHEEKRTYVTEAILCIAFGTTSGLGIYAFFLHFNIAIFGWNLGLIFAPLAAGYAETYLANKMIGQSIGAVSAFILFVDTVIYGFILKNPTLGFNLITIGTIGIILQAAFPTVINYIIFAGLSAISYFLGKIKRIIKKFFENIKYHFYKDILKQSYFTEIEEPPIFDEEKSNEKLNNLDFYFMTSTDILNRKHSIIGQFHATVIVDKNKRILNSEQEKVEQTVLTQLKQAKDDSLIKLAENVKAVGGNAILDLDIQYSLIGLGGDSYQITTMGIGLHLE